MSWISLGGTTKQYQSPDTGEIISYRQARARGVTGQLPKPSKRIKYKPPKIPIRYPMKNKTNRLYKNRKQWLQGLWQLVGRYQFKKEDDSIQWKEGEPLFEFYDTIGYSTALREKNYPEQQKEAINYAMSQLKGSGWSFDTVLMERWFRR